MRRQMLFCLASAVLALTGACGSTKNVIAGYAVGGSVSGLQGALFLRNGNDVTGVRQAPTFAFSQRAAPGDDYNVTVYAQPDYEQCTVTNGSGTVGATDVSSVTVSCTAAPVRDEFTLGMPVGYVIGPNDTLTYDDPTIPYPRGNPAVVNGRLYVSLSNNCSILGFNSVPAQTGAKPDFVLGEDALGGTSCPAPDANTFAAPENISYGQGVMAVNDFDFNRVLLFHTPPTSSADRADVAVGQPNLTSIDANCTASTLNGPSNVFITPDGKLLVADYSNNRVLIWLALPTTSGTPADLVLGQPDMTTCTMSDSPTPSSMNQPIGIWSDGNRLMVGATGFGGVAAPEPSPDARVLVWDIFPSSNGAPASFVLGAPDLNTFTTPTTLRTSVGAPVSIVSDGQKIFVAAYYTGRVNVYYQWPTVNNPPADVVLGQQSFEDYGFNEMLPTGLALVGHNLFVADEYDNRLLVFQPQ